MNSRQAPAEISNLDTIEKERTAIEAGNPRSRAALRVFTGHRIVIELLDVCVKAARVNAKGLGNFVIYQAAKGRL